MCKDGVKNLLTGSVSLQFLISDSPFFLIYGSKLKHKLSKE